MNQYMLISRLKVQNANAIAGFTWGFPAITHFLGFTHNIERKLKKSHFSDISLSGCAVIAHEHHVHTYGKYDAEFTQNRNPPYLSSHNKTDTPPVIEEGKMNMTVSLIIGCDGMLGNRRDAFVAWLERVCLPQRLAGGSILNHHLSIEIFSDEKLYQIRRKLLPGFFLMDQAEYLKEYYEALCEKNPNTELLDAWLDFAALKKAARPKSNLITKHLLALSQDDTEVIELQSAWQQHLEKIPYSLESVPEILVSYFKNLEQSKANKTLLQQWQNYLAPNEQTDADWEYIPKPKQGYLVPIMTGYKAISSLYPAGEVKNTRDNETPVCFVEAVHSVGEWKSVHRIKSIEELNSCLWHYHYEENWYLCKQSLESPMNLAQLNEKNIEADTDLNFY